MGWGEVPVPPNVTMGCPGSTVYGSPPTVTATVDQSATITFYLDGTAVSSSTGTSASYTPGAGVSVGTHTLRVDVSNVNGTDSVSCSWTVFDCNQMNQTELNLYLSSNLKALNDNGTTITDQIVQNLADGLAALIGLQLKVDLTAISIPLSMLCQIIENNAPQNCVVSINGTGCSYLCDPSYSA